MTKMNLILHSIFVFICSTFANAQSFKIPQGYPAMQILSPLDVYSGKIPFAEIPELQALNSNTDPEIRGIMYLMARKGIGIGLGDNPNRASYFDLSAEVVDLILKEPAAEFGMATPERTTEVGRLHFLTHDPVHFIPDVPGVRLHHLKNPKEMREKIVWLLLAKEALASAWSTQYYAKIYWNYRNELKDKNSVDEFRKANDGLASIGNFSKADYMDITIAAVTGQIRDYYNIAKNTFSYDAYLRARDAGVPMVFPRLDRKMSPLMEKLVVKYGFAPLMTVANYMFPTVGYLAFNRYAQMQAEFYMQPWYVKWSDQFQIGEELDSLKLSLENSYEEYRKDTFLKNIQPPPAGLFEVMHIRNNVAHLGRKIVEIQTLGVQNPGIHSKDDQVTLNLALQQAKTLNDYILKFRNSNTPISSEVVNKVSKSFTDLVQFSETNLPVSRLIPIHLRLGMADYEYFWKDIHAVVQPRPEAMTKFMSEKGVWRKALVQRLTGEIPKSPEAGKETISSMEEAIATRYNQNRRGEILTSHFPNKSDINGRLTEYIRLIRHQIENVYITQIQENLDLSFEARKKLVTNALQFLKSIESELKTIQSNSRSAAEYLNQENKFFRNIEVQMTSYAHILELSENQKSEKRILEVLSRISTEKANRLLTLATEYCSFIAKACLGKKSQVVLMGKIDYAGIESLANEIFQSEKPHIKTIDFIDIKKNADGTYIRSPVTRYTPVRKSMEIIECKAAVKSNN